MIVRLISTYSALLLATLSFAQNDAEWLDRARNVDSNDRSSVRRFLEEMSIEYENSNDSALKEDLANQLQRAQARRNADISSIIERLELRSRIDAKASSGGTARETAREILNEPTFRDSELEGDQSWLGRALSRIGELFNRTAEQREAKRIEPPSLNMQPLAYLVLIVLISAIIALAVFALRGAKFGKKSRIGNIRRSILDEDEPDRTLDEWLQLADKLQSEGRLREVVRCLYIAILLRLDASRIIRFERSETNWEHLAKIDSSSAPEGVDYRGLTKLFDTVWYGEHHATIEDCATIRSEYEKLNKKLREAA